MELIWTKKDKMVIVNIIGGLGNQMFQYAFAVALNEKHKKKVRIDTHHYHYIFSKTFHGNNFYHNGFEISKIFPNATLKVASPWDIMKVSYYMPNFKISRVIRKIMPTRKSEYIQPAKEAYCFDPNALSSDARYYEGYWMAYKYFEACRERIQEIYSFPQLTTEVNKKYAQILGKNNSVTIHVRRGDYVKLGVFANICTREYYRKAIDIVRRQIDQPEFFVFSNDQGWCVENLKDAFSDAPVHFVDNNRGNESYRDMQLMSMARCNIMANSSFSWWGAFLNAREDQIVVAPSRWMNDRDCSNLYGEKWIKVEV